jgi:hypothetical protein
MLRIRTVCNADPDPTFFVNAAPDPNADPLTKNWEKFTAEIKFILF